MKLQKINIEKKKLGVFVCVIYEHWFATKKNISPATGFEPAKENPNA